LTCDSMVTYPPGVAHGNHVFSGLTTLLKTGKPVA
jgi:hypothetical protein